MRRNKRKILLTIGYIIAIAGILCAGIGKIFWGYSNFIIVSFVSSVIGMVILLIDYSYEQKKIKELKAENEELIIENNLLKQKKESDGEE
jgi:phosphate/sulfate permease